jgi:DNA processing protein
MSERILSAPERVDWVRLIRTDGVGPATMRALLERFGSAAAALEALPGLARNGGRKGPLTIPPAAAAQRELEDAARLGAAPLAACESTYPAMLAAADPPPPLIYVKGHASLLLRPCVALVGARNASAGGRKLAEDLAAALGAKHGFVVVSGLARGIDTAAHRGSVQSGTVAVLAGGVDNVYPPENRGLYEEIAAAGAIVSEMPCGFSPLAQHFPRRNRIISGLSRGVVVVEAAAGSGSLITARFALEQGREVFAVPGSPLDPRSKGANDLIRQGATLTETADDVVQVFLEQSARAIREPPAQGGAAAAPGQASESDLAAARRAVTELLSPVPVEIDELIRLSGCSPPAILTVLLELELGGRAVRTSGQRVSSV